MSVALQRSVIVFCAGLSGLSTLTEAAQPAPDGLRPGIVATGFKLPAAAQPEREVTPFAGWNDAPAALQHAGGPFALRGNGRNSGLQYPLDETWSSRFVTSPPESGWPLRSVHGLLRRSLPGGWGVGLGMRHNEYNIETSDAISVLAERQWGNFRGAYTLYSGISDGMSAESHQLEFNYFYAGRNSIGLSYTNGRDVELLPARGLVTVTVDNWAVGGQHWLTPSWALTYDVVRYGQASSYRRQGLRLGIRHSF